MEFLCPSCQKMLTVPEQFAGQPMKCPLCGNAFQAPSLAPAPAASTSDPKSETYTYSVAPEPERATLSSALVTPKGAADRSSEPAAEKSATPPPRPSSPPTPPGEYGRKFTLQLKPQLLPYIPAGALFLIFILTFFPWVGAYPNGLPLYKQNAWQAAFNSYTSDYDDLVPGTEEKLNPGVSALTLFWLLIFLAMLALAIAVAVVPRLRVNLPPVVRQYWAWRMIVICGLSLILLLFMVILDLARFPLEDKLTNKAKETAKSQFPFSKDKSDKAQSFSESYLISAMGLQHTNTFRLVFFLLIITVICALLDYWIERRGPNKPLPRIDMLW